MATKKDLIIFDMDQTITKNDTYQYCVKNLCPKEEYEDIVKIAKTRNNWIILFNRLYSYLQKEGKGIEDVKKVLETLEINPGMKELFDYLEDNKEKYDVIILSSGYYYQIKTVLSYNRMLKPVKEIISTHSKIEGNIVKVFQLKDFYCNICNPCQCKSCEIKEYYKKNKRENYGKVIFVCDGGHDVCLAKDLNENDILFPRKDFALYRKLDNEGLKNELKCEINPWVDGYEIISFLKNN